MEVILLEKIRNLGDLGEKINVKSGYGRNYLIPKNKAVAATKTNLKKFEERRAELEQKAQTKFDEAKLRADALSTLTIEISALASEEGKLYGALSTHDIANAITDAGQTVEKREILLPEGPIREIGEFKIGVQVHSDVTADVTIIVVLAK